MDRNDIFVRIICHITGNLVISANIRCSGGDHLRDFISVFPYAAVEFGFIKIEEPEGHKAVRLCGHSLGIALGAIRHRRLVPIEILPFELKAVSSGHVA